MRPVNTLLFGTVAIVCLCILVFWVSRCTPAPTPAQEVQMVLIGACEGQVLAVIEKSPTRLDMCLELGKVKAPDLCADYVRKVTGRVCAP